MLIVHIRVVVAVATCNNPTHPLYCNRIHIYRGSPCTCHSCHCKFFPFLFSFFFSCVDDVCTFVHPCTFLRLFFLLILLVLLLFLLFFLAIEFAQESLDLLVVLLDVAQGLLDVLQRGVFIGFVRRSSLVLAGAVVLDLLASLLDLVQTQCRR